SDISWFNMRARSLSHGLALGLDADPPPGVSLTWMPEANDAPGLLDRGGLDAGFSVYPEGRRPGPDVVQLLEDGGRTEVTRYFQQTGCFQPNHHYVIQDRIVAEHPWLPMALYAAFEKSKQVAYERHGRKSAAYLYF